MDYLTNYKQLVNLLAELQKHKTSREVAIVITELEKVVAYYKMYVIGLTNA